MSQHRISITALVFLGLGLVGFTLQGYAGEKKITKKDVPAAVLKACDQAYPNAIVKGYSKETEQGKTFYEVETIEGKTRRDMLYKPDGSVEEIEESMSMSDLPDAVSRAFMNAASGAKATKVEKVTRGDKVTYEFAMGKGKSEMVVDESGQIVKQSRAMPKSKVKKEAGEED